MFQISGKIKIVNDTQTFNSGFTKREFILTTLDDKYPQDLKFEVLKEKCDLLEKYTVGTEVTLSFDIRGNEYQGKYYVNLNCWKIDALGGSAANSGTPFEEAGFEPSSHELSDQNDDIPF